MSSVWASWFERKKNWKHMKFWRSSSSVEEARRLLLWVMKLDPVDYKPRPVKFDATFSFPLTEYFSEVPHWTQGSTVCRRIVKLVLQFVLGQVPRQNVASSISWEKANNSVENWFMWCKKHNVKNYVTARIRRSLPLWKWVLITRY
jgi:hypothetical protein